MAIYHLSAKIVSRATGRSVVGAAAYRSAEALHDERIGQTFDYTRKFGVEHTEILAPTEAPTWVRDRTALWNAVEQIERRKDAQLAREIEIGMPVELTRHQQVHLLRDFTQRAFVSQGMVADIALHRDNAENPHAHVLLTTRELTSEGFGAKHREWNARTELIKWRAQWAEVANEHLLRAGLEIRIDHRTLEAQGIDLIPGRKIGVSLDRQQDPALPRRIAERVEEQRHIAQLNGESILADPTIALRALTHQQSTFTKHDIARFLNTRTDGVDQFRAALLKVTTSPELVTLDHDDRDQQRYTTREVLDLTETQPSYARHDVHISMDQIDAQQQAAAEQWREKQRAQELNAATPEHDQTADLNEPLELSEDDPLTRNSRHELSRDGLEDDLDL